MADMKVEGRFSGTITLDDISESAYQDILNYIKLRIASGDAQPTKQEAILKTTGTAEKKNAKPGKLKDYANMQNDSRLRKIDSLYLDFAKNPGLYDLVEMSVREYVSANPWIASVNPRSIGKKLAHMQQVHSAVVPCGSEKKYFGRTEDGHFIQGRTYFVPVRRATLGSLIRSAREEEHLSTDELSGLIGYDKTVIRNWENDSAVPSSEAMAILKKTFGNDIFKTINM